MKAVPPIILAPACMGIGLVIGLGIAERESKLHENNHGQITRTATTGFASPPERFRVLPLDPNELATELDSLEISEIPAALRSLSRRGGLKGIYWREQQKIKELIGRWYAEDPEGTLAWIESSENPNDRQLFYEGVVEVLIDSDPEAAVALMEQRFGAEGTHIDLPPLLLPRFAKAGPELLVRALAVGIEARPPRATYQVAVPVGYDFRSALDGLLGHVGRMNEGESFQIFPNNLLSDWAREDPQAAYEWVRSQDTGLLPSMIADSVSRDRFFEGFANALEAPEFARQAAELAMHEDNHEARFATAWSAAAIKPEATLRIAEEMASDSIHQQAILDLLEAGNASGGPVTPAGRHLFTELEPAARLDFLKRNEEAPYLKSEHFRPNLERLLLELGHTREEIAASLPLRAAP